MTTAGTINESTMSNRIEQRVDEIRKQHRQGRVSHLEQEILLVSEQLERTREVQEEQRRSLVRSECTVDTDLMRLEVYNPMRFQFMFKIRDNLKTKLLQIDKERRGLRKEYEREVRQLQDRLFSLLSQQQLGIKQDANTETS